MRLLAIANEHPTAATQQPTAAVNIISPFLKRKNCDGTPIHTVSNNGEGQLADNCPSSKPCWPAESPRVGGSTYSASTENHVTTTENFEAVAPLGSCSSCLTQTQITKEPPASAVHSHGNESFSTISVEDCDAKSDELFDCEVKLPACCSEKSCQHASAVLARLDSMHVTCGTQQKFPLVAAVCHVYTSTVGRYCGHLHAACIHPVRLCKSGRFH
jgi:hypothetical protein